MMANGGHSPRCDKAQGTAPCTCGADPLFTPPAVPDPTVEALSEAIERVEAHTVRNTQTNAVTGYMLTADEWRSIRVELRRILAARAAAPDALRGRIQALCDAAMRNNYHPGAANVSVPVADLLAVLEEGSS